MVMETVQIRLTSKLIAKVDHFVKEGIYPNRSEAVRDAVRRLILLQEIGELGEELGEVEGTLAENIKKIREYSH